MVRHALVALALVCVMSGAAPAQDVAAAADGDLFLALDFEDAIEPTGAVTTAAEGLNIYIDRKGDLVAPGGATGKAAVLDEKGRTSVPGELVYVDGVTGKGLFMPSAAENLLSAELADIAFADGQAEGVKSLVGAHVEQATTEDALFGDTCLKVTTAAKPVCGIQIPIQVPGGQYETTGQDPKPALFLISAYVKADVPVEISLQTAAEFTGVDEPTAGDGQWQRLNAWVFSADPVEAVLTLTTKANAVTDILVDGLQLEMKPKNKVAGSPPKAFPYGKEFSADTWTPGGTAIENAELIVRWKNEIFPVEEGTFSVWMKGQFNRGDCQDHMAVERVHVYYQLEFQTFRQYSLYRRDDRPDAKDRWGSVRVARPETLRPGQWHLLTGTWSNKDLSTKLYFDGELVGERESHDVTQTKTYQRVNLGRALNGVLDELRVYSRALSAEEIADMYREGQEALERR